MIYLDTKLLEISMNDILKDIGVKDDSSHHLVASLIQASLRGVDSHGINLFPHYCREIEGGRINKNPEITIKQTAVSAAVIDANHGLGHHVGIIAMDKAVELAKQTGIGAVSVKNSSHFGAAFYFALRAAQKDCLGFAFTNADALVKVYNSKKAFFGTNPICFTAPMANEEPFCLDMATSIVSWNKIQNYRQSNQSIPSHWACDEEGRSVTDPHKAKTLNPIGEYKGFGLGAMVDILCALLANGPISKEILPMYNSPLDAKRKINHFFLAIDISKFVDVSLFKDRLASLSLQIRNLETLQPDVPVMVAGDPEKKIYEKRLQEGIPISQLKLNELLALSEKFKDVIK